MIRCDRDIICFCLAFCGAEHLSTARFWELRHIPPHAAAPDSGLISRMC